MDTGNYTRGTKRRRRSSASQGARRPKGVVRYDSIIPATLPCRPGQRVKFNYVTAVDLTLSSAGAVEGHFFSANSPHDPDVTGVGHQPLGWDQWANFYNHYLVEDAYIQVEFVNNATTGNYGNSGVVGVCLTDDLAVPTGSGGSTLCEQPKTTWRAMTGATTRGKDAIVIRKRFNAKRFFQSKYDQGDCGGEFGANPADLGYFCVFVCNPQGGTDTIPITAYVSISYLTRLGESREVAGS